MKFKDLPKIAFLVFPLLFFVSYSPVSAAAKLRIIEAPKEIDIEASSSAEVEFSIRNKKTPYFLAAALCKEKCSKIFGGTFVGDTWAFYRDEGSKFYPISTDEDGFWSGELGFIANKDSKGYKGPGEYMLRVGRYTATGKTITWCDKEDMLPITIRDDSWDTKDLVIDDISHIRQVSKGTKIKTHGLATVEQGPLGADVFYLEDDFAGIKVDLPKGFTSGVRLGDKVEVGCTVEESRGEKYIKVAEGDRVSILETNLACRAPSKIASGVRLDDWEGRLVEVEGEVVETSGDTFYLDDGSGRIKVYIRGSTGINKPPMSRGDTARARGIISQWGQYEDGSDNYRLLLRYQEDLAIFPKEDEEHAINDAAEAVLSGEVLGAAATLPETGGIFPLSHFVRRIDILYRRVVAVFSDHLQPKL